jgi:hypothetical protein
MVDYYSLIFTVAGLLLMIHFAFIALTYMISKILSNNNLETFSKHEFNQAIFSIVILGSIFSGFVVVNNLFCVSLEQSGYAQPGSCTPQAFTFTGMQGTVHLNVARSKLSLFYNDVRVLGKGALKAYDWADFYANLAGSQGLMKGSVPFMGHQGVHAMIYSELFDILSHILVFLKFQELFLLLNSVYFFPPFLYFGIVLRILPFTRKLGGLLLGITLGLFYILPYFYIGGWIILESTPGFGTKYIVDTSAALSLTGVSKIMGGEDVMQPVDTSAYVEERIYDTDGNVRGAEIRDPVGAIIERYDVVGAIEDDLSTDGARGYATGINVNQMKYEDSSHLYGDARDYLTLQQERRNNSFVEIVARVVLSTAFISIFAIIGTISGVKEISKIFGGDIEIAGLTRLI